MQAKQLYATEGEGHGRQHQYSAWPTMARVTTWFLLTYAIRECARCSLI